MTLHHIFVQDDDADNLEFRGEAALWVPKLAMFMAPWRGRENLWWVQGANRHHR